MELPALNVRPLNVANAFVAADALRGDRVRNALLQRKIDQEAKATEARTNFLSPTVTPSAALAAGGGPTKAADAMIGQPKAPDFDSQAFRKYAALDPAGASQMLEITSKLDDRKRDALERQIAESAKLLLWVEQQQPADKPAAWATARAEARRKGLDLSGVPERYDPAFVEREVLQALSVTDILARQRTERTPLSPEGRVQADVDAGRLSPEMADIAKQRLTKPLVDMSESNKVGEALLEMDLGQVGDMQKHVNEFADFEPRMRTIAQVLESGSVETGRLQEATLPLRQFAQSLGWNADPNLPQEELAASAMAYIVPRMRVAGSGSTSDMEMNMFKQAAPNLSNTTPGNVIMARSFLQLQERNRKALNLARAYLRKHKSLEGFDEHADRTLGPVFPRPATQPQYDALEAGTVYVDTDGRFKVKR
jgi:hypothetical protein